MTRQPNIHRVLSTHATLLVLAALLLAVGMAQAQPYDANHPELYWHTFETDHFIFVYHDGAERTANTIARIAEEIYGPVTSLYGYEPDTKISFVVKDTDDYANGGAYYYNNKIVIWCTALDYDLRGSVNWLRNVVTHEFTHIIQLGASRKLPRPVPAVYFQVLAYEEEKRPDVLYGYPNVLASYPVAMTVMPMWFAEGTAQANHTDLEYDYWDSHRDMQLRVRTLNDSLLSLNDMEVFGKNSLGNEGVYNHGFALVLFIREKYGEQALRDLSHEMSKLHRISFDGAVEDVLHISADELYADWTAWMDSSYARRTEVIRDNVVEGEPFARDGYANLYPRWGEPDGDKIYYSSNAGHDYMSQRSLMVKDLEGDEAETLIPYVASPFDITEDGRWLIYSQITRQSNESNYADLYLYDLEEKKKVRLTRSARAMEPVFLPDESAVIFVLNKDGTKDLARIDLPERDQWMDLKPLVADSVRRLTDSHDGSQVWRPRVSPDGEWIAYSWNRDVGRDIRLIRPDGSDMVEFITGPADQRDPAWSADGESIIFSSDETGIFNLYRYSCDPHSLGSTAETVEPLTNVVGGAFMPDVREDGAIVYTQYSEYGFEVRILEDPQPVDYDKLTYDSKFLDRLPPVDYDDTAYEPARTKMYKPLFESMFLVPRIGFDYGKFKPGMYVFSNDVLERLMMFGGFAMNTDGEFDAFGLFDFRALRPTLFLEGYYLKRIHNEEFDDPYIIKDTKIVDGEPVPIYDRYGVDYSFHLMEVDGGARMKLWDPVDVELRAVWSRYQAFLEFEDLSSFHYTYFIGRYVQTRIDFNYTDPSIKGNVHPKRGLVGQLTAAYEDNDFIDGFEINQDKYTVQEVFTPYRYLRFEGDVTGWWNPLGDLVIQPRLRGGYLDHEVDPFMFLYAGGLHGMKGYSYYSMGGSRKVIGSVAVRHPIITADRPRIGWMHFDGLYGGVFYEAGDAWSDREFSVDRLARSVGFELRTKLYSWYGYPTAVTFSAARGLDHITHTENNTTTLYDPGWRYYLTVLFEFETIFPGRRSASRRF